MEFKITRVEGRRKFVSPAAIFRIMPVAAANFSITMSLSLPFLVNSLLQEAAASTCHAIISPMPTRYHAKRGLRFPRAPWMEIPSILLISLLVRSLIHRLENLISKENPRVLQILILILTRLDSSRRLKKKILKRLVFASLCESERMKRIFINLFIKFLQQ